MIELRKVPVMESNKGSFEIVSLDVYWDNVPVMIGTVSIGDVPGRGI